MLRWYDSDIRMSRWYTNLSARIVTKSRIGRYITAGNLAHSIRYHSDRDDPEGMSSNKT